MQDVSASLPGRLLALSPGQTVLDFCAAPGGKTMQLADTGAHVIAIDRSAKRLERVQENLDRTRLASRVTCLAMDAEKYIADRPIDAVLVDAPCSAFGTLRRHPEGAWIKHAEDIANYPKMQTRLLNAALAKVKPGGTVIYCVCSPLPSEGRHVIETALKSGNCRRDPVKPFEISGFEHALTQEGDVWTLPGGPFAHDIFFTARLIKTA